jgi:hypothetical protein
VAGWNISALINIAMIWIGLQFALYIHDAILILLNAILPAASFGIVSSFSIVDSKLKKLTFGYFSKNMDESSFDTLYNLHTQMAIFSDEYSTILGKLNWSNIKWLKERIVLAIIIYFVTGRHGHTALLFWLISILTIWSVYRQVKLSSIAPLIVNLPAQIATLQLIGQRSADQFQQSSTEEEREELRVPRNLEIPNVFIKLGGLLVGSSPPTVGFRVGGIGFGPYILGKRRPFRVNGHDLPT